ncbi:hypothetical protein [Micromonospora chersina]
MVDEQVAAGGHGEHPGIQPEQAGEQLAAAGPGGAGDDDTQRLLRSGLGHPEPGGQRGAAGRLGEPVGVGHVDRGERTRLHQSASR